MTSLGQSSIENDAHGIKKLLLKNSSKLNKFLHSEVNQLIQHIIAQDQDGQNNIYEQAWSISYSYLRFPYNKFREIYRLAINAVLCKKEN